MADRSTIEWTDATWNVVTGCTKVSPGCDHCYAETFFERFHGKGSFSSVSLHPERLEQPLHWRKPRRIFVNSMSDLFHATVPKHYIGKVWDVMRTAEHHQFQVLTKRAERMERILNEMYIVHHRGYAIEANPLDNVWVGVSLESPAYYSRIHHLHRTPAAVRFLSCEPLLHRLPDLPLAGIDWVIVGGESGLGARPMHPDWVRDIRDQCQRAGVAFFFKQWGRFAPYAPEDFSEPKGAAVVYPDGRMGWVAGDDDHLTNWSRDLPHNWAFATPVGKKHAGRVLDDRTWDEMPATEPADVR